MQNEEIYSPHVNQNCICILNIFGMAVELKEEYEFAFNIKKGKLSKLLWRARGEWKNQQRKRRRENKS